MNTVEKLKLLATTISSVGVVAVLMLSFVTSHLMPRGEAESAHKANIDKISKINSNYLEVKREVLRGQYIVLDMKPNKTNSDRLEILRLQKRIINLDIGVDNVSTDVAGMHE